MVRRLVFGFTLAALLLVSTPPAQRAAAQAPSCPQGLRKIDIGISVSPPNVVHTTPYVAKALVSRLISSMTFADLP